MAIKTSKVKYQYAPLKVPQLFGDFYYFSPVYKKQITELNNLYYNLNWAELKMVQTLYQTEENIDVQPWNASKLTSFKCKIKADKKECKSYISGFNTIKLVESKKIHQKNMRAVYNIKTENGTTLQLQIWIIDYTFSRVEATKLRNVLMNYLNELKYGTEVDFYIDYLNGFEKKLFQHIRGMYNIKNLQIVKCKQK
jgi:hypothetical protein